MTEPGPPATTPEPAPPADCSRHVDSPVPWCQACGEAVDIDPLDETAEERRERLAELDDECEFCTCSHTEHAGWCCVHNPGPAPAGATPAPHDDREATHPADEHYARRGPAPVADDLPARLRRASEREHRRHPGGCDDVLWEAAAAIDHLRSEAEQARDDAVAANMALTKVAKQRDNACRDLDAERACHVEATAQWLAAEARVSVLTTAIEAALADHWCLLCNENDPCHTVTTLRAAVSPTPEPPEEHTP